MGPIGARACSRAAVVAWALAAATLPSPAGLTPGPGASAVAVAVPTAASPTAGPVPSSSGSSPSRQGPIDWQRTKIQWYVLLYRWKYDISSGRDVAAYEYLTADGHRVVMVTASISKEVPKDAWIDYYDEFGELITRVALANGIGGKSVRNKHAEQILDLQIDADGTPHDRVTKAHSELQSVSYTHLTLPTKRIV